MAGDLILSLYPLHPDHLAQLRPAIGKGADCVSVSTIPGPGFMAKLRYLGSLNADTLYIVAVTESDRAAISILKAISLVVRARRRAVIEPDFRIRTFGVGQALVAGATAVMFTAIATLRLLPIWFRIGRLLAVPRVAASGGGKTPVLYLQTNAPSGISIGGAATHALGVIGGLLKLGLSVDVLSPQFPAVLPERDALTFHLVPGPARQYIIGELNHHLQNQRVIAAGGALSGEDYGFIYQRMSLAGFAGVSLSRSMGRPLVIEYNGSEVTVMRLWGRPLTFERLTKRVEKACLRHAHLVVTVSDLLREELIAKGVETGRIVCHPNGVNTDDFDPGRFSTDDIAAARGRLDLSGDAVVVTFVGTFGPWHGAEVLAHTLKTMVEEDRERLERNNIHMLFVGDGARRAAVEAIVAELDTRRRCRFTGLIDPADMPLIMAASDILVSPQVRNADGTKFFGSPTKLFEYLASARPVIASDLSQISEVLAGCPAACDLDPAAGTPQPGQCGVLVAPGVVDDLARAIWFLAENPDWRRRAGTNGRQLAFAHYTWERHVDAILAGLRNVWGDF